MNDPALAGRPDVLRLIPVGPSPIDVAMASATLRRLPGLRNRPMIGDHSDLSRSLPYLLPCGRSSEDIARREFANAMRLDGSILLPTLPAVLPALSSRDLTSIAEGRPTQWCLRRAALLIAVMRKTLSKTSGITSHDDALKPTASACVDESGVALARTLHDLADDIEAYANGRLPTEAELERAPVLENWVHSARPVRAMVGNVHGHPSVKEGRRSRTSELFFTDGHSFARTHSRLYRLGARAS